MKIRRARLTPYGLPLTRRLQTAHGWLDERRGWLLEFETDSGARGRGDACPFPGLPVSDSAGSGFGMESWRICGQRLEALAGSLLGRSIADRAALGEACATLAPDAPAARFAVDCALHELAAVVRSSSVADLLADASGTRPQPSLAVNALVSASRPGEIAAEAVTVALNNNYSLRGSLLRGTMEGKGHDADVAVAIEVHRLSSKDRLSLVLQALSGGLAGYLMKSVFASEFGASGHFLHNNGEPLYPHMGGG